MLELRSLSYSYPGASRAALSGIDLQLEAGQCLGLLGSNGAGKTTLLSLLSNVLATQQGEIIWEGPRSLALVPQQLAFYAGLKVGENLHLFADLYRLRGSERRERLAMCVECTGLADKLNRRADSLSGGEQRRLNFAIGLLQPAQVYLFDEATVGVDAQSRQLLLAAVEQLTASGKAVIYTSHYLEEVERVAQRILLLHEGQVRLDLDTSTLLGADHGLLVEWPQHVPEGFGALLIALHLRAEMQPHGVRIAALNAEQFAAISQFVSGQVPLPTVMRFGRPSLEQLYLRLNGGQL